MDIQPESELSQEDQRKINKLRKDRDKDQAEMVKFLALSSVISNKNIPNNSIKVEENKDSIEFNIADTKSINLTQHYSRNKNDEFFNLLSVIGSIGAKFDISPVSDGNNKFCYMNIIVYRSNKNAHE